MQTACVPRTQVPYTAVHNASRTQNEHQILLWCRCFLPSEPVVILRRDRLGVVQEEPCGSFLDSQFLTNLAGAVPIFQVLLQHFAIHRIFRKTFVDVSDHPVAQVIHFGFLVSGLLAFQNRVLVPADGFACQAYCYDRKPETKIIFSTVLKI